MLALVHYEGELAAVPSVPAIRIPWIGDECENSNVWEERAWGLVHRKVGPMGHVLDKGSAHPIKERRASGRAFDWRESEARRGAEPNSKRLR